MRAKWSARFLAIWDSIPFLRIMVGAFGLFLLWVAYSIYVEPPTRVTSTRDYTTSGLVEQSQPAESSGAAIALFTAACAAIAFSLKLKIDPFAVTREKETEANAQRKKPGDYTPVPVVADDKKAEHPPVPAALVQNEAPRLSDDEIERKIAAATHAELFRRAEYFFRVSSWNGKKVLYACFLASKTPSRILDLRTIARRDQRMSFDYAYGYLVAASSTTLFQHNAPADGAYFEVLNFPEQAANLLLKHIEGQLDIPPADRANKIAEIRAIAEFFNSEPPPFAR
jgi:hypothetical protein